jgi:hypothetical protein
MSRYFSKLRSVFTAPYGYFLLLAIAPLPFLYFFVHFFTQLYTLETFGEEVARIHKKSVQFQSLQQKESGFLSSLQHSDHFYIDQHLETLCFLEPEIKKTEALLLENPHHELLKKRLHFLKEGPNRLLFSEVQTRQHHVFQEVEEKQQHFVEMNEEDLKKMLSLIEGVTIWPYGPKEKRPQLIIKDFQLTKKETPSQEFVYMVNMHLIKRENASS